jgi:hypothetical protein
LQLQADGTEHTTVHDLEHDEHEGLDEASLREHEEVGLCGNTNRIMWYIYSSAGYENQKREEGSVWSILDGLLVFQPIS